MTYYVPNFATVRARRGWLSPWTGKGKGTNSVLISPQGTVGGVISALKREGPAVTQWVDPTQASDSVSDRFSIRWVQNQIGLEGKESDRSGIRKALSLYSLCCHNLVA